MTLLITELHVQTGWDEPVIVFGADRRISAGQDRRSDRQKIYPIPWLRAGIGYAGLAQVEMPSSRLRVPMNEHLLDFEQRIRASNPSCSLADYARALAAELDRVVAEAVRRKERAAIHLAGFNKEGQPEFWSVQNVAGAERAFLAREDFQQRDARGLSRGEVAVYRQGIIEAHEQAWKPLEDAFGGLRRGELFKRLTTPADYADWLAFKLSMIAQLYERYSAVSRIGNPVDAFAINPAGATELVTLSWQAPSFIPK